MNKGKILYNRMNRNQNSAAGKFRALEIAGHP